MSKKDQLANSFASTRRKKAKLSIEEIDKIVDGGVVEPKIEPIAIKEPEKVIIEVPKVEVKVEPEQTIIDTPKIAVSENTQRVAKPKSRSGGSKRSMKVAKIEEEVIKTSLDIPIDLYEDMKIYLIRQKQSMREYLLDMIRKDLARKSK